MMAASDNVGLTHYSVLAWQSVPSARGTICHCMRQSYQAHLDRQFSWTNSLLE